jgi:regulator of sigma E protease
MYIIIMLLLISLLILVHEAGHFWAAKLLGIKVNRFGFGLPIGPTLWEKKIGDVTYSIHAFLLGGYVSFPDDDPDSELPADDPGRLKNRKVWERAVVVSAGVTANAILAFVIVMGVIIFTKGVPTDFQDIYVEKLAEEPVIAREAGLQPSDKIHSINGIEIRSFLDFKKILEVNKAEDGYVSENDIQKQMVQIANDNPELMSQLGLPKEHLTPQEVNKLSSIVIPTNWTIETNPIKSEEFALPDLKDPYSTKVVSPNQLYIAPSEQTLKTAISNNKFVGNGYTTFGELAKVIADTKHVLNLTVLREGEPVTIEIAPNAQGIMGFQPRLELINVPLTSITQVFTGSWDYIYSKTNLMLLALYKLITGQLSLWDLHGPIAITKIGGDLIESRGMANGWLLTALISIDLAIINLLPIPALDGGHLLFLGIEKLRGRPVEEKYQEAVIKYGFLFLISLMLFVIFNDILALVTGKF